MNKSLQFIEEKIFLPLAIGSAFLMTCLTTADATGRYLISWPIVGAYEVSERYLMVICFYFAISYAYREGANIRITLFVSHLPKRVRLILNYVVQGIAVLYCLALFVTALICNLSRIGETLLIKNYNLPLGPVYVVVPLGLITLSLRMTLDFWQIKKGNSGLFKDEETEESCRLIPGA